MAKNVVVLLGPEESGVDFVNRIAPDETINILTYEYLYNGGGIGAGDINNDGFEDVFFAGSQIELGSAVSRPGQRPVSGRVHHKQFWKGRHGTSTL